MTLRELRVMVQALPPESATYRAAVGNDWGSTQYLLRAHLDEFRHYREQDFPLANGAKKSELRKFKQTPIPGSEDWEKHEDEPDVTAQDVYAGIRKIGALGTS